MNRPYELPYYPAPPVLGIVLNLLLTGVLVRYLWRTDRLALLLSAAWIVLGVVAYYAIGRTDRTDRGAGEADVTGRDTDNQEAPVSSPAGRD